MTIYRLPVVVSATDLTPIPDQLPPKLQCEDFDATGARKDDSPCKRRFESSGGDRYKCGKGCRQGAFLYPRSAAISCAPPRKRGLRWPELWPHQRLAAITQGRSRMR